MTQKEKEAIKKAIVEGIIEAFRRIIVQPFPKNGEYSTILFNAKHSIEIVVDAQLRAIRLESR